MKFQGSGFTWEEGIVRYANSSLFLTSARVQFGLFCSLSIVLVISVGFFFQIPGLFYSVTEETDTESDNAC